MSTSSWPQTLQLNLLKQGPFPSRAQTVDQWFQQNAICRYGCPVDITDNGLEFAGDFTRTLKQLGIIHRHTSKYHPQANGAVERLNGVVKKLLTTLPDNFSWDDILPTVISVRSAYHSSIKMSPAEALMGKKMIIPRVLSVPLNIDFPSQNLQINLEKSSFDNNLETVASHHDAGK